MPYNSIYLGSGQVTGLTLVQLWSDLVVWSSSGLTWSGSDLVWFDLVWSDFGLIWFGLVLFGSDEVILCLSPIVPRIPDSPVPPPPLSFHPSVPRNSAAAAARTGAPGCGS